MAFRRIPGNGIVMSKGEQKGTKRRNNDIIHSIGYYINKPVVIGHYKYFYGDSK